MAINAPKPTARTHKPPEERRREILDAAALVFADLGYRCADVDRIAERARVGKGTVYRLFGNKEALFLSTVEKAMEDLTAHVNDPIEGIEDPEQQIRTAIHRYFDFFDRNPGTVELFIQERAEFRERDKPIYFIYQENRRALWLERFERLVRLGRIRSVSPELALDMTGNLVYGAVFSQRLSGGQRALSEQSDAIADLLFNGIFG